MRAEKWLLLLALVSGCSDDPEPTPDPIDAGVEVVDAAVVVMDAGVDGGVSFADFVIDLVNRPSETEEPRAYETFQSLPDSEDPATYDTVFP